MTILHPLGDKAPIQEDFKEGDKLPLEVRKALIAELHSRLRGVVKIDKRFRTYEDLIRDDAHKLRNYVKGKAIRFHFLRRPCPREGGVGGGLEPSSYIFYWHKAVILDLVILMHRDVFL